MAGLAAAHGPLARQRGHQRGLALGRRARFQGVEEFLHCIILGWRRSLIT
jgi:hypothetical protein